MKNKVEVKVTGVVQGFVKDNETEDNAKARLVLEAEMLANDKGTVRLHLSMEEIAPPKHHIETRPATHPEEVRHFGLGSRTCVKCNTIYAPHEIPTIEEGCKGCK